MKDETGKQFRFILHPSSFILPKRAISIMEQQARPTPGRRLREAWAAGALQVPGVFNPLVARLAERSGFQAVYLSGAALSASAGLPDVGLLSVTEFADAARAITRA